ncbi:class I SAM-dependent methyltransferase [Asaia prunellae]|uniref:class I SAM-dependent methyltransferase n=1 Tax=Asaia prunellae TaxID=610245 RepID=UPI001FB08D77|nr:class I SAM-dependent methyltransferase [Asaia prunellae]
MTSTHDNRIITQFTRWAACFAALPIHAEAESMAMTVAACDVRSGTRVLDVACGPGIVSCALAAEGADVTALDMTPAMLIQGRELAARRALPVTFDPGNAYHLPYGNGTFDRVVTRYSFHHMIRPLDCLKEMVRVCCTGGRIVVIDATPAPECQQAYDQAERVRDPSHINALTRTQLLSLGEELGLTTIRTHHYRLEACLNDQVAPEDQAALHDLFAEDIASGTNRLGMGAWHVEEGIRFFFPISIIVWQK